MRPNLEKEIDNSPTDSLIVNLNGQTDNTTILEYYTNTPITAFINLSSAEGVPVSIMEAMSFDIPIIATDVGGASEIVSEHLGSGILVSPDDSNQEVADEIGSSQLRVCEGSGASLRG